MRRAELSVATAMVLFSVYLMWKSTELPIGWRTGEGPGGGAFPFWLAAGMLICAVVILVQALRGQTPESRLDIPFIDPTMLRTVLFVVGSLTAMILAIHWVGTYVSVPIFLIIYMRVLGKHSWKVVLGISLVTPVVTFIFFEKALLIILPKGITEEFFYLFY